MIQIGGGAIYLMRVSECTYGVYFALKFEDKGYMHIQALFFY